MEQQDELNIGIGDKEPEKLKPAEVAIANVQIKKVGEKGHKKIVFACVHPDKKDETFDISSVKYEFDNEKLKIVTTWYNTEKKEKETDETKLQKNSAVAHLMRWLSVEKLNDLVGKKCMTTPDEKNYLVFKGY